MSKLVRFTDKGIYCPQADCYIDPWKPVSKALITHGHSDHARRGHKDYLCHQNSVNILKHRLGKINVQGIKYDQPVSINGVKISFHPAGHVLGSAQIKLDNGKESWVVSGDYKLANDNVATPFDPVPCDHFITESTFGLPVFRWQPQAKVIQEINHWWLKNTEATRPSVLSAYSLGKAQRILKNIDASIGPIVVHSSIAALNEITIAEGVDLPSTYDLNSVDKSILGNALILCPPMAMQAKQLSQLKNASFGVASGWMGLRGARRRRNVDRGFILSDHADWQGLNEAIKATGAEHVYVTHGYTDIFSKWLNEVGYVSQIVETEFEGEVLEKKAEIKSE